MSAQQDQDGDRRAGPTTVDNPFDVIAYAGWEVLGASAVAIVVMRPSERGGQLADATVRGWYGCGVPDRHGHRLLVTPEIPLGTVTAVDLEDRPDGSTPLSLAAPGDVVAEEAAVAPGSALLLRGVTAQQVGLLVLVQGPTRSPREGMTIFLGALLAAAERSIAAERGSVRQRVRVALQEREEERRRWARELHDETLQQLGALQVLLTSALRGTEVSAEWRDGAVEVLRTATTMVSGQISSLRHLITELRPATLDELGLSAPLHALARRTEELTGLRVEVHVSLRYSDGLLSTRLLPDIEVAVYRVVQEALTNASRHSGGTRAWISVTEDDHQVRVEVRDNGKGIHRVDSAPGFGIIGMQERALLAGGQLEVLPGTAEDSDSERRGMLIRLVVPATHRPPLDVEETPDVAHRSSDADLPHS